MWIAQCAASAAALPVILSLSLSLPFALSLALFLSFSHFLSDALWFSSVWYNSLSHLSLIHPLSLTLFALKALGYLKCSNVLEEIVLPSTMPKLIFVGMVNLQLHKVHQITKSSSPTTS